MIKFDLEALRTQLPAQRTQALSASNAQLDKLSAQQRVEWAFEFLPKQIVLSSSFGIQSAVSLHLVTQIKPDIPVILTDTGYLFEQTYRFIDQLQTRLSLNLQVYRAAHSSAWQEARYGRLWEQGLEGIKRYNHLNKVEPLQRAFDELNASTWISGLRRTQAQSRARLPVLQIQHGVFKLLPIIDWSNKDVHYYLKQHNLPYHPLWEEGYVSVGDVHTSQPLQLGMTEEQTRFHGLTRECGLHEESGGSGI